MLPWLGTPSEAAGASGVIMAAFPSTLGEKDHRAKASIPADEP
jgi:hypothetical protein